jgi:hypothetical protein
LGYLQFGLSQADDRLQPELARLEAEWKQVAPRHEEAQRVRDRYEAFLGQVRRIKGEDRARDWLPMLFGLTEVKHAGVELRGVSVSPTAMGARSWRLQLEGTAAGTAPRIVMEGYRQALQRFMEARFRLDEALQFRDVAGPATERAGERATFTLTSTFAPKTP